MRHKAILRISVPPRHTPPPEPDRDAAQALLSLAAALAKTMHPLLEPPPGLSRLECRVLEALPIRQPTLPRDLARQLGADQGHLSRTLKQLESKGLIARQHGEDGRQWPLGLKPAGRLQRLHISRARKQAMARLLQPLSTAQRNDLAAMAIRLRDLLTP